MTITLQEQKDIIKYYHDKKHKLEFKVYSFVYPAFPYPNEESRQKDINEISELAIIIDKLQIALNETIKDYTAQMIRTADIIKISEDKNKTKKDETI